MLEPVKGLSPVIITTPILAYFKSLIACLVSGFNLF